MRRDEVRALGELAGDAAAGIASQARDVHAGIAQRVFGALGPSAAPVRLAHDRISGGAYAAARALTGALVRGGAQVAGLTQPPDAPSIGDAARGRVAIGALNGAFGDRLHRGASALQTSMAIRRDGHDVSADAGGLARAFPDATRRLVVFVHGLCETDEAWRLGARRSVPYGDRLRAELGYTPIYVRYNSGRHISHNGRELSALLHAVVAGWPVEVTEIALVGHSMGGLVARGACHYAGAGDTGAWREPVRHVFMLGTPHTGAPLELAANAACHAASLLPETRPFVAPLKARSAGVKDLGYGYVVDEDWEGHDPDAFWTNTGTVVPFMPGANHYFVSATISREADARLGRVMGDLLVLHGSAWARERRGERLQFPVERYCHLGGVTHLHLLNHPAVYAQIRRWLAGARPQLPAPNVA
ncbi:MAG TPA: hypothetical protein VHX62_18795 [Solirubrobacteraceae bacterium]|jgi:hypothetical protein|nr:hypothetical protein [Solirubrobacteraceae bacterium]